MPELSSPGKLAAQCQVMCPLSVGVATPKFWLGGKGGSFVTDACDGIVQWLHAVRIYEGMSPLTQAEATDAVHDSIRAATM